MDFKIRLIDKAKEFGFIDLRIAKASPFDEEIVYFKQWLENNFHAKMDYMSRNIDKRYDIRNVLEDAKSIIVLAHPYFTGNSDYIPKRVKYPGKIARFAKGGDYHKIVLKKLKQLSKIIQENYPESLNKCYVDTGPNLEKQWAVRSGIGWQGKNGIIINKDYGSFFFLGIIITTIELEPDKPVKDYCGTCTLCLDACPAKAIVKPKVIDANKCISYCTVETKSDEMPDAPEKNLSDWAYGCDICQEVCPWNKIRSQKSED